MNNKVSEFIKYIRGDYLSNPFKEWLKTSEIKDMDTVKGDIARAIISDDNFPEEDDRDVIYGYFKSILIVANEEMVLKELLSLYTCYLKINFPH